MSVTSTRRADRVVNLSFHGIGRPGRALEPGEARYWVEVDQFEDLVDVIRRYPFFRITFDDGNASDVAYALPTLLRHGLKAAFFVVANRLDQPGSLSSKDVRSLVKAGMTVGSHGMQHQPWRALSREALRVEVADATSIIAGVAKAPITEVAFPFGSYDRRALHAVRREGFSHVYTTDGGSARPGAWLQSRCTIVSEHGPDEICRLVDERRTITPSSVGRTGKAFVKRWR